MSDKTVTRAEIGEAIRKKCSLPRTQAVDYVEVILNEITQSLKTEKEVKIPLFGVFFTRHKKPRIGRNPKTMKETTISERDVVSFRMSRVAKDRINSSLSKPKKR